MTKAIIKLLAILISLMQCNTLYHFTLANMPSIHIKSHTGQHATYLLHAVKICTAVVFWIPSNILQFPIGFNSFFWIFSYWKPVANKVPLSFLSCLVKFLPTASLYHNLVSTLALTRFLASCPCLCPWHWWQGRVQLLRLLWTSAFHSPALYFQWKNILMLSWKN